jgi:hypothetical protein
LRPAWASAWEAAASTQQVVIKVSFISLVPIRG